MTNTHTEIRVIPLTEGQLNEIIETATSRAIAAALDSSDKPLKIQEAADMLGISVDVLRQLSHAGEIPCRNVGRGGKAHFIYSRNALSAWAGARD